MHSWLLATAVLCPGADAQGGCLAEVREPVVIHFCPLPKGQIHTFLMVSALDGDTVCLTAMMISGGDATSVRDSCRRLLRRRGWTVGRSGDANLVLVKNAEGRPVLAVTIEGIPASVTPVNPR